LKEFRFETDIYCISFDKNDRYFGIGGHEVMKIYDIMENTEIEFPTLNLVNDSVYGL